MSSSGGSGDGTPSSRAPRAPAPPAIDAAHDDDLPAIRELLRAADLPEQDLDEHRPFFLRARRAGELVGAVALEAHGTAGLLRSLVVRPDQRGAGLGGALVDELEKAARQRGIGELWLLTTTAEGFFGRRGWRVAERDAAPGAILASCEFSALCPASAVCMTRSL